MTKDQWVDDVLASAKRIKKVSINPYLHTRVKAKLERAHTPATISLQWALVALAPVMVLLFLNISLWRKKQVHEKNNAGIEQVINAYSAGDSYLYSSTDNGKLNEQD